MRDFTLKTYSKLLDTLVSKGYRFVRFDDFLKENSKFKIQNSKLIILRHDVDRKPENALRTAQMENELGIKGTYYFRIVPESFDEKLIREIAGLGHEIGYHYEEVDTVYRQVKSKKSKVKSEMQILRHAHNDNEAMITLAYEKFKVNLEKIRKIVAVNTICMHGSPLSPFDNKIIWEKYSYKDLGIIGEPYFDIDWNEFGYLTDTGRRWNGSDVSVRDKVNSFQSAVVSEQQIKNSEWLMLKDQLKKTQDIINAIEQNKLPDKLMITVHPERWTDSRFAWLHELVWQNVKNMVKKLIVSRMKRCKRPEFSDKLGENM